MEVSKRKFRVKVGEKTFTVEVEEIPGAEAPAAPTGRPSESAPGPTPVQVPAAPRVAVKPPEGVGEVVKAPLPGTILRVACKKNQRVEKGQLLLVLEAMKMENEMYAPVSGVVTKILVSQGQHVEYGQDLVHIS